MFDEMKKPLRKNLVLYPPWGMARIDWSRRCAIHQFLFHIFFLEIQVTEKWSVLLDSYSWQLSQEIPVLRIEEKISDACLSILIFSCVCAVHSGASFFAIVKSCRIMFNGVHCMFVDLKKLSYWFRSETPCSWEWKTFRSSNWNLWIMT